MSDEAFTRRTTLAKLGGAVLSAVGGGSFLAGEASGGNRAVEPGQVACVLAPQLTEGPYDVAGETLRRDIRDDHPGTRPSLHLRSVHA
jgi:hypothetical protein